MEKFAAAYARALFPARFASHGGHDGSGAEHVSLAPGALEIGLSADIYRAIVAAERLSRHLRQLAARSSTRRAPAAGGTPVGCG